MSFGQSSPTDPVDALLAMIEDQSQRIAELERSGGRPPTLPVGDRSCVVKVSTTMSVPNVTTRLVVYDTDVLNGEWRNGSNNGIIVPYSGVYSIASAASYTTMLDGSRLRNIIRRNGATLWDVDQPAIGQGGVLSVVPTPCVAGDEIDAVVWQNSGTTRTLDSKTTLTVTLLS